jgi:hypothetical protein
VITELLDFRKARRQRVCNCLAHQAVPLGNKGAFGRAREQLGFGRVQRRKLRDHALEAGHTILEHIEQVACVASIQVASADVVEIRPVVGCRWTV